MLGLGFAPGQPPTLVYDTAVILENLRAQGMEPDEALEFAEFSIFGAVGAGMPLFLERATFDELESRLVAADDEA